jgi:predicted transcriptional regulator
MMYDAVMRTTIDLPDDLHRAVKSLAHDLDQSLSRTVGDLVRRGLGSAGASDRAGRVTLDEMTGLPVFHVGHAVTTDDVQELLDEE